MSPLKKGFKTFAKEVIPEDASDIQRSEMRMAFYAGAICYSNQIHKVSDMSEDEAMERLSTLHDEVENIVSEFGQ